MHQKKFGQGHHKPISNISVRHAAKTSEVIVYAIKYIQCARFALQGIIMRCAVQFRSTLFSGLDFHEFQLSGNVTSNLKGRFIWDFLQSDALEQYKCCLQPTSYLLNEPGSSINLCH